MDIGPNDEYIENNVEDFNSGAIESEDEENNNIINEANELQLNKYNSTIYNFEYTYSYFKTHEILYTNYKCPYCNTDMKIVSEKLF